MVVYITSVESTLEIIALHSCAGSLHNQKYLSSTKRQASRVSCCFCPSSLLSGSVGWGWASGMLWWWWWLCVCCYSDNQLSLFLGLTPGKKRWRAGLCGKAVLLRAALQRQAFHSDRIQNSITHNPKLWRASKNHPVSALNYLLFVIKDNRRGLNHWR